MKRHFFAGLQAALIAVVAVSTAVGQSQTTESGQPVPEKKQTDRGLYVTAEEAYSKWEAEPEKVRIIDVRTPEEFIYVGHAEMAWNVPFAFQTLEWHADAKRFAMKPNPDFVSQAKELFHPDDTLLLMCRSGGRSAMATNLLTEAGFENVYNIIDGMEGDIIKDPNSPFHGKRMQNGWKNSELPWTYRLDPERMRLPGIILE